MWITLNNKFEFERNMRERLFKVIKNFIEKSMKLENYENLSKRSP